MLLGPKHDLLARLGGAEELVAPSPRKLAREPRVRELPDGECTVVIDADEHAVSVPKLARQ
jgi:hypothetical protein